MEVCRLSSHISLGPHSLWRSVDPQSCHQADHTTPSPLDHWGCWTGMPKRVSQGPVTIILCMIIWKEETSTELNVFIRVRVTYQMDLTSICRMPFSFAGQYCMHAMMQFCHRGLGLIPGQSMWDLWWTRVALGQVFLQVLWFLPSSSFSHCCIPSFHSSTFAILWS